MLNNEDNFDPYNLIKISLDDFKAAEILFNNKLYPQAIWSLEQSLEKATKAILICLDFVKNEKELINIGHNPASGGLKLLEEKLKKLEKEIETHKEVLENFKPQLIKAFDEYIKSIENLGDYKNVMVETINEFADPFQFLSSVRDLINSFKTEIENNRKFILQPLNNREIMELNYKMDRVYSFVNFIIFIDKYIPSLKLETRITNYVTLLLCLSWLFDNELMSKLRYHLPELNEDSYLVCYSRKVIDIVKDTNILENLKELINDFKNNQISN